jgi:hypothetical protein
VAIWIVNIENCSAQKPCIPTIAPIAAIQKDTAILRNLASTDQQVRYRGYPLPAFFLLKWLLLFDEKLLME